MMEDKQKICDRLVEALQATDNAWDVKAIRYKKVGMDQAYALVVFRNGAERNINVSLDSGTAMIRDIMDHLGC